MDNIKNNPIVYAIIAIIASIFLVSNRAITGGDDKLMFTDKFIAGGKDERSSIAGGKDERSSIAGGKETKLSFNAFCFPKGGFKLQPQQLKLRKWMAPGAGHTALLAYHEIGSGKTCTAIQIAEAWVDKGRPLIIMPASLIPGFYNEIRGPCANYVTGAEREAIAKASPTEYRRLVERYNTRIDKYYTIMSYNKFLSTTRLPEPSIIIVDEVQNICGPKSKVYNKLRDWVYEHPNVSIVVMSGTPLFDKPGDLTSIARMLRITDEITPESIPRLFKNKVSYFPGAPAYTFPEVNIKILKLPMSKHQAHWYKLSVEAEYKNNKLRLAEVSDDFYIKSRQKSNVVYPNGVNAGELSPATIRNSLGVYSCKLAAVVKRLKKGRLAFIYTGFTKAAGIALITHVLGTLGWKSLHKDGPGPLRYAIWSGDQTGKTKDLVRQLYNSPENDNGSRLQLVIGSPAIKEGVSLFRCRQVHILEAYWNHSRLAQVYGRAVRYCSHKTLPKEDRKVTIYIYAAYCPQAATDAGPLYSIDLYMLAMADEKKRINDEYTDALKKCSFDKYDR